MKSQFILYVSDQRASARFYARVLGVEPSLDVAGMTEFSLTEDSSVGLMPASGIKRLLGDRLPDPTGPGPPKAELYLVVEDAERYHARALAAGARELSGCRRRDWGHVVAYSLDPDDHVLAFAHDPRAPG